MPHTRFERSFAVIDASCLICLLHLNQSVPHADFITALALRYQAVYIPRHVLEEVRRKGRIRHRMRELVRRYPVLEICDINNRYDAQLLYDRRLNPEARIHRGEAEVITQARERGVSEVLMDDRKGREMAERHTLVPKGTAKLLIEFKRTGVRCAEEVKPLMRLLVDAGKLQLKTDILDKLLDEVGES
jgi:predicted nucleic acid-binding protein